MERNDRMYIPPKGIKNRRGDRWVALFWFVWVLLFGGVALWLVLR